MVRSGTFLYAAYPQRRVLPRRARRSGAARSRGARSTAAESAAAGAAAAAAGSAPPQGVASDCTGAAVRAAKAERGANADEPADEAGRSGDGKRAAPTRLR